MAPPETFQDNAREHLLSVVVDDDAADRREVKFELRDLVKESPAGETILDKVNVDIPRAQIVGIIGPSGSGKSTFLRALNRLWEPPEASVFLDGQDISLMDVLTLRRRVGMLFQLPSLFEGTVADNVRYGPLLRGKKLNDDEVYKYLSLADLDPSFYNKNHNELSIGQAQRVALARTLANEPEVLLLDEPTSALDPISTQNIETVLLKLKNTRGMTVVMVSHSIKQIQRIADVVCLLVNGAVVEVSHSRSGTEGSDASEGSEADMAVSRFLNKKRGVVRCRGGGIKTRGGRGIRRGRGERAGEGRGIKATGLTKCTREESIQASEDEIIQKSSEENNSDTRSSKYTTSNESSEQEEKDEPIEQQFMQPEEEEQSKKKKYDVIPTPTKAKKATFYPGEFKSLLRNELKRWQYG